MISATYSSTSSTCFRPAACFHPGRVARFALRIGGAALMALACAGITYVGIKKMMQPAIPVVKEKVTDSVANLIANARKQCAQALQDHTSGLSIILERDPIRKEQKLKRIVLTKNKEWKAKYTGIKGFFSEHFTTTPFITYKSNIDRHTKQLGRFKRRIAKQCPTQTALIAEIDAVIAKLATVTSHVIEHDHYLREKTANKSPMGSSAISLIFKFIPSPFKL